MRLLPLLLAIACAAPASARLTPADLASAGVLPPPGARLPQGLPFVDQDGRRTALAAERVPTVLLFADYSCAHLCGPGVTLTAGALHDTGLVPGRDYRMIVIGMDGDGPAAARRLRDARLADMAPEAADMRLLSGTPRVVAAAERALGYHAVYDAAADQFAHDAAIFVFAADGALSSVLPETATTADRIRRAVTQAGQGARYSAPPPGVIGGLVALCYGLAAAHGIYGHAIAQVLRIAGAATIALMGLAILFLRRRAAARC